MLTMTMLAMALGAQDAGTAGVSRVRDTGDRSMAVLLRDGTAGSATFKRLVDTINATNGLVYVERGHCRHHVRACLALTVRIAGSSRVLRILVDGRREHDELVSAIGHELQHAVEALSDPHVTNDMAIYNFFDRIAPSDKGRFETQTAIQVGLDVFAELRMAGR